MECTICLETYESSSVVKLDCGHNFHKDCIEKWKIIKNACPVCREKIDIEEQIIVTAQAEEPRSRTNYIQRSTLFINILGYVYVVTLFMTNNSLYFYMAILNFIVCHSFTGMIVSFISITNNAVLSMNSIHFMYILFPLNLFFIILYGYEIKRNLVIIT